MDAGQQRAQGDGGGERSYARILLRNPAIALSIGYLLLSLIGIIHSLVYYSFSNLNIFDYWELGDLFLAGFRRPEAFLWSVVALLYVGALQYLSRRSLASERWKRGLEAMEQRLEAGEPSWRDRLGAALRRQTLAQRLEWLRRTGQRSGSFREWTPFEWFAVFGTFLIFVVAITFLSVGARIAYHPDRPPDFDRVVVTFTDGTTSPPLDSPAVLYAVGRTNRFLIAYDRSVREPVIVPWESVTHVRHEPLGPVGRPTEERDD